jgi:endonuclease G
MDIRRQSRHQKTDQKGLLKLAVPLFLLLGIIFLFWNNVKEFEQTTKKEEASVTEILPEAHKGVVYHKPHFSLSYVEEYELPEWVAYRLTVDMMNSPKTERYQDFNPDPAIATQSAHFHDYKQSGYRRGHLAPSADMAWNKDAMDASFLMSNIAPMLETFNDGIWLELEHNVRDWSRKNKNILVVTGPVLTEIISTIGENEVAVPKYFYKAVFTINDGQPDAIGFLFDQTFNTDERLQKFIVPVDSIEKLTGLDLFANLYGDWDEEIRLEKLANNSYIRWPFNEKWYLERMEDKTN